MTICYNIYLKYTQKYHITGAKIFRSNWQSFPNVDMLETVLKGTSSTSSIHLNVRLPVHSSADTSWVPLVPEHGRIHEQYLGSPCTGSTHSTQIHESSSNLGTSSRSHACISSTAYGYSLHFSLCRDGTLGTKKYNTVRCNRNWVSLHIH